MLDQPIIWFIKLAIARLRAQWRAILTIIIGVLLTAIIGASAPLYTSAIAQVGLEQRLNQHPIEDVNVFMRLGLRVDDGNFLNNRQTHDQIINDAIKNTLQNYGGWHEETINWAESVSMTVLQAGQDVPDITLKLAHYDSLPDYAELVAGEWWDEDFSGQADAQIAITTQIADVLGLNVGDVIVLEQRGWDSSLPITLEVGAIFAAENHLNPYWMNPSPIRIERSGKAIQSNIFITRRAFDEIIPQSVPQTRVQVGWRVLFNHSQLSYSTIAQARSEVGQLQNNIRSALEEYTGERAQIVYETDLSNALGSYGGEVKRLGAPFALFLTQLGALVLFFLVVMGELVRRNERREIGMLKARGVRDSQLLALRGMETLIICLLSTLVAPFIARQLLIALTPLFTNVDSIPLEIRPDAFLYAGLAGLVAWVVLVATLIPTLNSPLILTSGSAERSQGVAWWQRYYLDVILLIVGLGSLIQVGSARTAPSSDSQSLSDPLILLMPTLLIFALGSVSLRLFPIFVNIGANILGRRKSLAGALAGWQVSREPAHYGRITFLLALAVSMGWFALSFQRTVQISQLDRALYQVGSDIRLDYRGTAIETVIPSIEGVQSIAEVTRHENISTTRGTFNLNQAQLLAVDHDTLQDVIYWRSDWGDITRSDPFPHQQPIGEALPIIPQKIGIWGLFRGLMFTFDEIIFTTNPSLAYSTDIQLILNDESGKIFSVPLIPPELIIEQVALPNGADSQQGFIFSEPETDNGWIYLEADLTPIIDGITGELRLQSIIIQTTERNLSRTSQDRALYLRDMTLIDSLSNPTAVDWLKQKTWDFVNLSHTSPQSPIPDEQTDSDLMNDSLLIYWMSSADKSSLNMTLNYPPHYTLSSQESARPNDRDIIGIPALISRSMAEQQNITIGQNFEMLFQQYGIWFQAVAINDYFPTLYGQDAPFVVVDADTFNYVLTYINGGITPDHPRELWVRLTSAHYAENIVNTLELQHDDRFTITHILRADAVRQTIQTDLLAVGLIGLLILSAIVGFLLSLVSLLTYASLAVQARRTEFAVLRAMGFGTGRIIFSMAIEQTFVIITSIILGILIGLLLSTQVLPMLSIDTTGRSLVPPFHVQVDGLLLIVYIGTILLILIVQLLVSSLLISRLTTTQALRQPSE